MQTRMMTSTNEVAWLGWKRSRFYRGAAGAWAWKRYILIGAAGTAGLVNYSVKKRRAWKRDFIHEKSYLYWKIYDGGIVEAQSAGSNLQYLLASTSDFSPDEPPRVMTLYDVIQTIKIIEKDDRIRGIIADFSSTSIPSVTPYNLGLAQIEEIQQALLELRNTKVTKWGDGPDSWRSIAFTDTFDSQGHYLLASCFDEIYIQPTGSVPLVGMGGSIPFFGRLAKWLGVDIHAEARTDFKSFVQPYIDEKFTNAQRENSQELLNDLNDNFMTYIARNRFPDSSGEAGLSKVKKLSSVGPFSAKEALKHGLIDGATYRQDILNSVLNTEQGGSEDIKLKGFYHYHKVAEKALAKDRGLNAIDIGVVYLQGTIGDPGEFGTAAVVKGLKEAGEDDGIGAVVLRIDSGGGGVVESDSIWAAVRELRGKGKPVVASFGNVSASGGYFVSTHADAIMVSPSTVTGSIGVGLLRFTFLQQFFDRLHITLESIFTGSRATDVTHKLNSSELDRLKEQVDDTYADFKERVCEGRQISPELIDLVAGGRVMTGLKAFSLTAPSELIDRIKGLARPALTGTKVIAASSKKMKAAVLVSPLEDTDQSEGESQRTFSPLVNLEKDQENSPYAPPEPTDNLYEKKALSIVTRIPAEDVGALHGDRVVVTSQHGASQLPNKSTDMAQDIGGQDPSLEETNAVLYLNGIYPIIGGSHRFKTGPFGRGLVDGLGGIRDAAICAAELFIQYSLSNYMEENPETSITDSLNELLPNLKITQEDGQGYPMLGIDVRLKRFPAEKSFFNRLSEASRRGDGMDLNLLGQYARAAAANWVIKTVTRALSSEFESIVGLSGSRLEMGDCRKGLGIGHSTRKNWLKAEWHGLSLK